MIPRQTDWRVAFPVFYRQGLDRIVTRTDVSGGRVERRLAAVLAADLAGYSRLMGEDELGTLEALKAHRREVVDPTIAAHKGRIVKTTGDGMLVEFASAVDAVSCAMAVQEKMAERKDAGSKMSFRIGINVGDIIIEGDDIFGDGVNVAARVENECKPGSVCLSGSAFDQVRDKTSYAFDELGERSLKNIDRPVRLYAARRAVSSNGKAAPAASSKLPALPDKPSIAVLPFQNMSGDPEQDYFADGMVEDIITALSRFKMLFVIARNSSFTYKGKAVDIKQVGRELGVRYVLEGSVRKAANRLRITGQLIDAVNGAHIWADKFDGAIEDVFDLQDKVASNVAGIIFPALQEAEIRLAADRPTTELGVYDLYLRAMPLMKAWAKQPVLQALALADLAVERDPNYGPALSMAAFCRSQMIWSGWADGEIEPIRLRGIELARRAIEAAADDFETVSLAAGALMNFGEDINVLKSVIDNALGRNPSSHQGWFWSGWMRTIAGEFDLALDHFDRSLRLDPRATRLAFHRTGIGICYFYKQQFDQAAAALEASLHEVPDYPTTSRFLAACYVQMGRLAEARDLAVRHNILPGEAWLKASAIIRKEEHQAILLGSLKRVTGESD